MADEHIDNRGRGGAAGPPAGEFRPPASGGGQGGRSAGTTPTTYRYTGQRSEATIGLYYYGARWYDPALGRFIEADTIVPEPGNPKALDRYAYVYNNPLRYADPTGHGYCDSGHGLPED